MKKLMYIGIMGVLCTYNAQAQNQIDALRYSQTTIGGTARSLSMGGAFGALGGDFSVLSSNPGGIGVYKHSEMSFSPTIYGQSSSTAFQNATYDNSKYNFYFNNAGFVYSYDTGDEQGWNNLNFGFGYNRSQDFNSRSNYQGVVTTGNNALTDFFKLRANNTSSDPFAADLAINSGLVYQPYKGSPYVSDLDSARVKYGAKAGVIQNRTFASSGGMGEVNFAFGGNYRNRLYLGGSINIISLNYNETATITERDLNGNIRHSPDLSYNQTLNTTGTGFNLKLGAIYRIADWVRVGGYVHTPSVLSLTDNYSSTLNVNYTTPIDSSKALNYSSSSPAGNFSYEIVTPARFGGSVAFIIQKQGILSADLEYLDYSTAHLNSDQESFDNVNNTIKNTYRGAYNLRLGGEYKIDKVFSLRAGYAYYQSPFKSGILPGNINANTISYTGGIGIRGESGYFLDFAYIYTQQGQYLLPYSYSTSQGASVVSDPASIKNITQNFVITLGVKF